MCIYGTDRFPLVSPPSLKPSTTCKNSQGYHPITEDNDMYSAGENDDAEFLHNFNRRDLVSARQLLKV